MPLIPVFNQSLNNGSRKNASSRTGIQYFNIRFRQIKVEQSGHKFSCSQIRKELPILFPFVFRY